MKNHTNLMHLVILTLCSLLIICWAGETKAQETDVETYINEGKDYIDARQGDLAIEAFTKAIELDPTYVDAYIYRGYVYGAIEQYEKAIADYTKIIELTPEDASIYNRRGLAYGELGQTEQEIADYTKAIEVDPTFAAAYYNRGYVYTEMEQYDQALADCTKVIEIQPENARVYNDRGYVYEAMGQPDQAIADYTKAIELNPEHVDAYYNRAESFFKMGKCDDVRKDIRQIHELGYRPGFDFLTGVEGKCPTYVLEVDDAEDDVENTSMNDDGPAKDMVKSVIESDGSNLYVTVTLKDDIAYYLEGHMAGVLMNLHFDTDNDVNTGGKLSSFDYLGCEESWCDYLTGFEYLISLMTCIAYDDGSEACIGASTSGKSAGFFSSYDTEQYAQGDSSTEDVHEFMWKSPREDITGNVVKTVIPYTEIGVVSGQIIRIVIEEEEASVPEDANSWDYLLTLK